MNPGTPRAAPRFARLPSLEVPPDAFAAELAALADAPWTEHFNQGYHDGGWSGLALWADEADPTRLYSAPVPSNPSRATPLLARCPLMAAWLAALPAPVRCARLLRLAPGSVIREHRDPGIGLDCGLVRLHLPIKSHPEVGFYVDGVRVVMQAGECWYLDLGLPHRVRNESAQAERVHLVVDCEVNDALLALLPSAEAGEAEALARQAVAAASGQTGRQRLERFVALALDHPALLDELAAVPADGFNAALCAAGAAQGLAFDEDEVRALRQEAQRRFMMMRTL